MHVLGQWQNDAQWVSKYQSSQVKGIGSILLVFLSAEKKKKCYKYLRIFDAKKELEELTFAFCTRLVEGR